MTRTLDPASIDALKKREACRLVAYKDEGGVWTIGYGHTGDVIEGATLIQSDADALFLSDVQPFCDCVDASVTVPIRDNQRGALVSFAYNVGQFAFRSSTLLKVLNAGGYAGVPAEMMRWVWVTIDGRKAKSPGLENRRLGEGGQWVQGAYVSGSSISPDAPVSPWNTMHIKIKAAGIAIAGSGITGGALTDAGGKLQSFASSWHMLAYAGMALTVVGVVWGIFRRDT